MLHLDALLQKIDQFVKIARYPLPKYTKIFGPYQRNSGKGDTRQLMIVQHPEKCDCNGCIEHFKKRPRVKGKGRLETLSLPKHLYESHIGEKLDANETVDHIDRDHLNNDWSNLQVLDRKEHSALDTRRVKLVECTCQECGKKFERSPRHLRDKAKAGKSGPFCSKSCAARNARYVQYGKKDKAPIQQGQPSEYFRRIKDVANKMASKWGNAITKFATHHLSPEDEEIALSEIIEDRDTVPIDLWRKYKHREVSGVQWRPEKEPTKKAMDPRMTGGPMPDLSQEDISLGPKKRVLLPKPPTTPFPKPDFERNEYEEPDPFPPNRNQWSEADPEMFIGNDDPMSKDIAEFAGDFDEWLPDNGIPDDQDTEPKV